MKTQRPIEFPRPIEYKGEMLTQITDGDVPYIVYRRDYSVIPFFVYREDGTLICSCAFKCAALGAATELNSLAAIAAQHKTA